MSSPSKRSTRSSQAGTPRRSTRNAEVPKSSPAPLASDDAEAPAASQTPRQNPPSSRLQSSPLFYQSSPAVGGNRRTGPALGDVSSPLRHMTNSQSTATAAPSSPLRQQTETQSIDGDRTPRASGTVRGQKRRAYSTPACILTDPRLRLIPRSI
ncbi:hypothetical protein VDGD_21719 [Verticillium dahliae]|nr:hypothetical protein VDGD_21719 [Verticillium dahliae]